MSVIAHWPGGRSHESRPDDGEPGGWSVLLKAVLTVVLVTAVVAAALGGATYVAAQVFIGMLS